jgi:hypothetical protein
MLTTMCASFSRRDPKGQIKRPFAGMEETKVLQPSLEGQMAAERIRSRELRLPKGKTTSRK